MGPITVRVPLFLSLPKMRPSRFRRWLTQANRLLGEVSDGIEATHARPRPGGGLEVRLILRGNCLTYEFDRPHLVAMEALLGSDPAVCLRRLTSALDNDDEWVGDEVLSEEVRRGLATPLSVPSPICEG